RRSSDLGRPIDGPWLQRLERNARTFLPHLRQGQGNGSAGPDLLPPGRARGTPTIVHDEPLVHPFSVWDRQRGGTGPQSMDRQGRGKDGPTDPLYGLSQSSGLRAGPPSGQGSPEVGRFGGAKAK